MLFSKDALCEDIVDAGARIVANLSLEYSVDEAMEGGSCILQFECHATIAVYSHVGYEGRRVLISSVHIN